MRLPTAARHSVLGLLVLCWGCTPAAAPRSSLSCAGLRFDGPPAGTNLILIVNDTMRRDRVGVYGGPARTPAFDGFARSGLCFERASTQAPWTKPSVATLFTARYPAEHGVLSHPGIGEGRGPSGPEEGYDILDGGFETLAEALRAAGFRTAAFVANPWLDRRFGFDQGFEVYDESFAGWDVPGEAVSRAALNWLAGIAPGERFFLYLHYMDSHRPYPPLTRFDVFARREAIFAAGRGAEPDEEAVIREQVTLAEGLTLAEAGVPPTRALLDAAYIRGVEQFDAVLGSLLERLERSEAWARTAVVVTSDHGEALFERGYDNHGNGLYEDEVGVPLAARLPGVSADAPGLRCPVGLIDLAPTLATYLGAALSGEPSGRDLLARAPGLEDAGERCVATEGVAHKPRNRAIRDGRYALILQPERGPDGSADLLFDLQEDPAEASNLLSREPWDASVRGVFERLRAAGVRLLDGARRAPASRTAPVDPALEQRLRGLGYVR